MAILVGAFVLFACGSLRALGFTLQHVDHDPAARADEIGASQFGIKHMLVWATAIVPLLLLFRNSDYDDFEALRRIAWGDLLAGLLVASSIAIVNLATIWLLLSATSATLKYKLMLIVLMLVPVELESISAQIASGASSIYPNAPIARALFQMGQRNGRPLWIWLNFVILAALLLFLRVSGFRLRRAKRGTQLPATGEASSAVLMQ